MPGRRRKKAASTRTAAPRARTAAPRAAALAAGGKDNGAPGLRPHYHANYYAAFVIGPDGKIEKAWRNVKATGHVSRVLREIGLPV